MKKGYIWAIVLVAAIIFGIVLVIVQCSADDEFTKNVKLEESGIVRENLHFSATGLRPGDTRDYTIIVTPEADAVYVLALDFEEENDGGLRDFIDVTLSYGDTVVETTLTELFAGKTVSFECDISKKVPARIHVVFSMSLDVGNEAQGATSDFGTYLTATRK